MSNRHVSLCLCITHTKPLIRVALPLGPLKTLGDGAFPVGEEGGGRIFLKDSFNQLAVWFGQPAEEGRAQGNIWGGKKEWMHNPISLYFPSSPASVWTGEMGHSNIFALVLPVKHKRCSHYIFHPISCTSAPCLLHPDHLRAEHSSCTCGGAPALSCPRTQFAQGTWNETPEEKTRISAQWKVRCTRWSLAHFPFSLHTCPAPLSCTLGSGAGWLKIPVSQEQLEKYY